MALLTVLLPLLMLGVVLALGRYEDLLLPREQDPLDPTAPPAPTVSRHASG